MMEGWSNKRAQQGEVRSSLRNSILLVVGRGSHLRDGKEGFLRNVDHLRRRARNRAMSASQRERSIRATASSKGIGDSPEPFAASYSRTACKSSTSSSSSRIFSHSSML